MSSRRPSFRARRLGGELRTLRIQAGFTQQEAGRKLHYNDQKISRFECGQVRGYHSLRAMLDLYGLPVNDWEPYLDLWELATKRGWWLAYGLDNQQFVGMEDEASAVRQFQASFVPGLLQTEDYAREAFAQSKTPHSRKWVDDQIEVRMRRQQRLVGEEPLDLHAVVHEPVLRPSIPPDIMRPQLFRLLRRSELPNVTVRVLPGSAGLHDGWLGTFLVLSFPAPGDPEIGYVEHAFGSVHIEGASQVRAARLRFDGLAELALSPEDSRAFIDQAIADL